MKILGIVLAIAGLLMMIYTGFNFVTKEKVVDLGPIEINKGYKSSGTVVAYSWSSFTCWRYCDYCHRKKD